MSQVQVLTPTWHYRLPCTIPVHALIPSRKQQCCNYRLFNIVLNLFYRLTKDGSHLLENLEKLNLSTFTRRKQGKCARGSSARGYNLRTPREIANYNLCLKSARDLWKWIKVERPSSIWFYCFVTVVVIILTWPCVFLIIVCGNNTDYILKQGTKSLRKLSYTYWEF